MSILTRAKRGTLTPTAGRSSSLSRAARHYDDTEGVEEISPGLPESSRATPGTRPIQPIHFARSAASAASISDLRHRSIVDIYGIKRPSQWRAKRAMKQTLEQLGSPGQFPGKSTQNRTRNSLAPNTIQPNPTNSRHHHTPTAETPKTPPATPSAPTRSRLIPPTPTIKILRLTNPIE